MVIYSKNAPVRSIWGGIGIGVAIAIQKSKPGLSLRDDAESDPDPEKAMGDTEEIERGFSSAGVTQIAS